MTNPDTTLQLIAIEAAAWRNAENTATAARGTLARTLTQALTDSDCSERQLAEAAGISRDTVRRMTRQHHN